jgi:hypothetical protein
MNALRFQRILIERLEELNLFLNRLRENPKKNAGTINVVINSIEVNKKILNDISEFKLESYIIYLFARNF